MLSYGITELLYELDTQRVSWRGSVQAELLNPVAKVFDKQNLGWRAWEESFRKH